MNNIYNKPDKSEKDYVKRMKTFLEAIIPMESNLVEYYNYAETEI